MVYESKKQTKQKKNLYEFMERHKVSGTVSGKKLGRYIEKKGYIIRPTEYNRNKFQIISKRGTILAKGSTQKRRINWWAIK